MRRVIDEIESGHLQSSRGLQCCMEVDMGEVLSGCLKLNVIPDERLNPIGEKIFLAEEESLPTV